MPIGKWVLRTACAQSVAWLKQGLPPVRMSVNLSMRQLNDEGLVREIEAVLAETGMDPELLELEVTESTIMHNAERAVRVLTPIKDLGVRLAIDDFGTGYSSLAHLKRFPIDTLKVDRSFIREVPNDAEDKRDRRGDHRDGQDAEPHGRRRGRRDAGAAGVLERARCATRCRATTSARPSPPQDFAELLRAYSPKPLR